MDGKRIFGIGVAGAAITGICCVTPLLPIVLSGLGLTGFLAVVYTDTLLYPLLAAFLLLAGFGYWRWKKSN